jgi:lipopolysaccharide export system permease protein
LILFRYLGKEILSTTSAVTLVLLMIVLSGRFVRYLAEAAQGKIDPEAVVSLMMYRVPGILELILPLSLFVGLLLALGRLYVDSEIRVLFAAGISRVRLAVYSLPPVVIVGFLVGWLTLELAPHSYQQMSRLLEQQKNRSEFDTLKERKFQKIRSGNGVIYVESIQEGTRLLKHVFIFQQGSGQDSADEVLVASRGIQDIRGDEKYLILGGGHRYELRDDHSFITTEFSEYGKKLIPDEEFDLEKIREDALPTSALISSDRNGHIAVLQWRYSLILLVPLVAVLAIVLSETDPRQGRYARLLPAIVLYFVYLVLLNLARDKLAGGDIPAWIGLWWVHLLFLVMTLVIWNWPRLKMFRYKAGSGAKS